MLNTASLSLQQAPPISIPFRFFLTAPLFSILAAVQLLLAGEEILVSRWLPVTLGFTHLLTLGFLAMVMCGALLQMLPVMAGAPVPGVVVVGGAVHLLLSLGTLFLVAWFLGSGPLPPALILLVAGFSIFLIATVVAIWRRGVVARGSPAGGMQLALVSLLVTVLLGVVASLGYDGRLVIRELAVVTDIHLGWGLAGWVGLLLSSVAFQLVPMFNVTPEYPQWMKRHLPWLILLALVGWSLLQFGEGAFWEGGRKFSLVPVVVLYLLFAFITLDLQRRRKRKVPDITLLFWVTGLVSLICCAVLWVCSQLLPWLASWRGMGALWGIGLLLGFSLSIVNGMLYKIVPFLSWFHLQNRQMAQMRMSVAIPHMKAFISDRAARVQFVLHLLATVAMAAAVLYSHNLVRPAAFLFLASNLLLGANLWIAVWRFRKTSLLLAQKS
ncbi:MAG: hypothetical protein KDI68_00145 [Gammaproteobacteria bacterium]|nr:hypothetical protein [Gammaproteobacteria bacterium]